MTDAHAETANSFMGAVQKFVTTAQLIKTLIGMLIGLVATCFVVYDHFAKESEIRDLNCKIKSQNNINNAMISGSEKIREALHFLQKSLQNNNDKESVKLIADEISTAISDISRSLDEVNDLRKKEMNRINSVDRKEQSCP